MKFNIGDIVSFLNHTGSGKVLKAGNDRYLIEDEDGFDDWHEERDLVIRKEFKVDGIEQKDQQASSQTHSREGGTSMLEKDLHFNQLVEFPKNYSNHQMLEIQLREAKRFLEKSRISGNKRVVLIHGVGEGRLKEEVHTMLERMDGLRFYDASYAEYGTGATEVEFY